MENWYSVEVVDHDCSPRFVLVAVVVDDQNVDRDECSAGYYYQIKHFHTVDTRDDRNFE